MAGTPPHGQDFVGERIRRELADLWREFRPINVERVVTIRRLVAEATDSSDAASLYDRARREAHKLVGALGTFGLHDGTVLARDIETALEQPESIAAIPDLTGRVERLLTLIDVDIGDADAPEAKDRTVAFLVGPDPSPPAALHDAARARQVEVRVTGRDDLLSPSFGLPDGCVVLVALPADRGREEALATLDHLAALDPAPPVLVLADDDTLPSRLEAARRGAATFLTRQLPPAQVVEAILQARRHEHAIEATIMAVDDDAAILAAVVELLSPHATRVQPLDDPARFWETLEATNPDLLVLDIDMPAVSGIELCLVVRTDPRWARLPVLFLTAHSDPETLTRVFDAGADDYVPKPIVGPELVTRITNRLERTFLMRQLAEIDSLTGVTNRRKSVETLQNLLHLAGRQGQPFTLAIVDLDHFKTVNDRFGHAVGDAVLSRLGQVLLRSFRGEDVVARWGGEEFVVGMYGMSAAGAVRRLTDVLASFRAEAFDDERGGVMHVTFSAGVAEFVADAHDLQTLYRAADAALYDAKAGGRNRVVNADPAAR